MKQHRKQVDDMGFVRTGEWIILAVSIVATAIVGCLIVGMKDYKASKKKAAALCLCSIAYIVMLISTAGHTYEAANFIEGYAKDGFNMDAICVDCGEETHFKNYCDNCGKKTDMVNVQERSKRGRQCPECGYYFTDGEYCRYDGVELSKPEYKTVKKPAMLSSDINIAIKSSIVGVLLMVYIVGGLSIGAFIGTMWRLRNKKNTADGKKTGMTDIGGMSFYV